MFRNDFCNRLHRFVVDLQKFCGIQRFDASNSARIKSYNYFFKIHERVVKIPKFRATVFPEKNDFPNNWEKKWTTNLFVVKKPSSLYLEQQRVSFESRVRFLYCSCDAWSPILHCYIFWHLCVFFWKESCDYNNPRTESSHSKGAREHTESPKKVCCSSSVNLPRAFSQDAQIGEGRQVYCSTKSGDPGPLTGEPWRGPGTILSRRNVSFRSWFLFRSHILFMEQKIFPRPHCFVLSSTRVTIAIVTKRTRREREERDTGW